MHAHKAKYIRPKLQRFGGAAAAVGCVELHMEQCRAFGRGFFLHGGGELKRMRGHHAVVMIRSANHCGGILLPFLDIMQGRVGEQIVKVLFIFGITIFSHPAPADSKLLESKHIQYAHGGEQQP